MFLTTQFGNAIMQSSTHFEYCLVVKSKIFVKHFDATLQPIGIESMKHSNTVIPLHAGGWYLYKKFKKIKKIAYL